MEENFLKKHWDRIVQDLRNPITLADTLLSEGYIYQEIYDKIKSQTTRQAQTREIRCNLNSQQHFICMHHWIQSNESELFKELEENITEAEQPQRKRTRLADETDNNRTGSPDLKKISTFAKLEKWISEPEISKKLICDLKKKLGEEGVNLLKEELKNSEPKTILCFRANNIDDIRKNKELGDFLSMKKPKFPSLTLKMFFKKSSSAKNNNTGLNRKREAPDQHSTVSSKRPNDPISNNDGPDMQENRETNVLDNVQPPMELQNEYPASTSDNNENKALHDLHEDREAGVVPQNEDTATPGPEAQASTSKAVNEEAGEAAEEKKTEERKGNKVQKKDVRNEALHAWALRQCDGTETELKNISDGISVINLAEHAEYPCFTAENVMVYKKHGTSKAQILFITNKEKLSISTKTQIHYHMFVCGVKTAVVLGPRGKDEDMLQYEENFIPVNRCSRFIREAVAPALSVFREIQKEELTSAICNLNPHEEVKAAVETPPHTHTHSSSPRSSPLPPGCRPAMNRTVQVQRYCELRL